MAIATFYHPSLGLKDTSVELSETESAHAIKSRRLTQGSPIQLINGQGLIAQACILAVTKRSVIGDVESIQQHDLTYSLTIATAIPKGDRQRTMIDMLSQLGVTHIVPLRCERSVTHFRTTMQSKWQRYAIEACKQSQNVWLPSVSAEQSIEQVLTDSQSLVIYADAEGQSISSLKMPSLIGTPQMNVTVLIGPEGGFSDNEVALLSKSCTSVSLGSNILRTELASVVIVSQLRLMIIDSMKDN